MKPTFTRYQLFVVALLAFLQFTVVLDFMILSPLGAFLLRDLSISPAQFGRVVSAYAFSAGISGLVAAGFADRFVVGTLLCGLAPTYTMLLGARIVTGMFGGCIGAVTFAIVTDLFPLAMRGRVAGIVQSSFAASQVLGLPIGLYLANHWGWHAPFLMIVGVAVVAGFAIFFFLKPITGHLAAATGATKNPLVHLLRTATQPRYIAGFVATMLLSVGGFMLMPFGSTFVVQNLHLPVAKLPLLYVVNGAFAMLAGPIMGKLSDTIGKYQTFVFGSVVSIVIILWYTGLTVASFPYIVTLNVLLFMGISGRMVSSFALGSALPAMSDRGAYMSINSSLQSLSGGVAAWVAGLIVYQANPQAPLEHYNRLGFVAAGVSVITVGLMYNVHRLVKASAAADAAVAEEAPVI